MYRVRKFIDYGVEYNLKEIVMCERIEWQCAMGCESCPDNDTCDEYNGDELIEAYQDCLVS